VAAGLPEGIGRPAAVLVVRLYLAPLGVWLGRELAAESLVVDADDDDAALLRSLGETGEAEAFERLARCWLPDADAVFAASGPSSAAIATRAGLDHVGVIPNTVVVRRCTPRYPQPAPPVPRQPHLPSRTPWRPDNRP